MESQAHQAAGAKGGNMDQQPSGVVGFREVDRDGNPVPPEREGPEPAAAARLGTAPNPFIAVLWLLAAGLMVGGVAALTQGPIAMAPMRDGFSVAFIIFTFAPQLVLIGIATVVILLLWHAWRWQRRRG